MLGREHVDGSVGTVTLGRECGDGSMGMGVWGQECCDGRLRIKCMDRHQSGDITIGRGIRMATAM